MYSMGFHVDIKTIHELSRGVAIETIYQIIQYQKTEQIQCLQIIGLYGGGGGGGGIFIVLYMIHTNIHI